MKQLILVMLLIMTLPLYRTYASETLIYVPPDYTATYRAQRFGMAVIGEISLKRSNDTLYYQADLRPAGLLTLARDDEITEKTRIHITPMGLRSSYYFYSHISSRRERITEVYFDWQQKKLSGTHRGRAFNFELVDGMMDRFALQIALINDVVAGRKKVSRTILNRDRIVSYEFTRGDEQTIRTPLGVIRAIEMKRYNEARDMSVSIWFAPDLHYIPVRVEQEENNERFVLNIEAVEFH